MATGYSPRIVTDGLVLALDAANVKSFRGEPTTNLLSQPTSINNWSTQQASIDSTPSFFREIDGNVIPFYKVTSTNITDPFIILTTAVGNISNRTFTYSVYLCTDTGQPTTSIVLFTYGNVPSFEGSSVKSATVTITTEPTRYKLTSVYGAGFNSTSLAVRVDLNQATLGYLYVGGAQLEEKAYETRFVEGTRGTTVATGGGWVDRSGNSNHGELVNGLTYDSSNLGSLVFDGVDDYVQTAVYTLSRSNSTVSSWINISDFSTGKSSTGRVFIRRSGQNFQQLVAFFDGGYSFEVSTNSNPHELAGRTTGNVLSSDISANSWFHFSLVFDSNVFYGYVNGILTGTAALSSDGFFDRIGDGSGFADNYPAYFKGKMSVFKLYNRALSASEVLQNYNATKGRFGL